MPEIQFPDDLRNVLDAALLRTPPDAQDEVATLVLARAARLTDRPLTASRLHSLIGSAWHAIGFLPAR